ncbi:hypothetical protein UlMin_042951 [Ulmus minor]
MAMPPIGPPAGIEGGPPAGQPPLGTDMTGICFRDQLWLHSYPLNRNLVIDYFTLFPFYNWTCNNELLRMKMTGLEYMPNEVMEPHLLVIRKQKRDGPEKVTPMLTYYVLDGSIYQAPQLCNVFATRVLILKMKVQLLNHILASLQHKIYIPPATAESEKGPETQQAGEAQPPC